jgi:hypothetical protein
MNEFASGPMGCLVGAELRAGCWLRERSGTIVLLPEKDGHPTAVVVKEGDKG